VVDLYAARPDGLNHLRPDCVGGHEGRECRCEGCGEFPISVWLGAQGMRLLMPRNLRKRSGPLMLRRLEDRIRELCRRAVLLTEDSAELHEILEQLRASVREHTQRLRYSAVNPPLPPEKRAL